MGDQIGEKVESVTERVWMQGRIEKTEGQGVEVGNVEEDGEGVGT